MLRITVRGPFGPPSEFQSEGDCVRVGRSEPNGLVLRDSAVSRAHAELRRVGSRWVVEDIGSSNGTFLNGQRVTGTAPLSPGDEILVGRTLLHFDPPEGREARGRATPRTEPVPLPSPMPGYERGGIFLAGESQGMRELVATIERVAASEATVLIQGESGTGKELVARLIHACSPRAEGPFVVVNCPALPGSLLESELFGVEKGVATGVEPRPGHFETARGGTLLLDEIGDMDRGAQAKILRTLEEKTVVRVGGREPFPLDVRILAATNHDLHADMERGAFRRDLYFRLNTVTVTVPPLRERREDIPVLVEHFLSRPEGASRRIGEEALDILLRYEFPGNVRELERIVVRAELMCGGPIIGPGDLPKELRACPAGDEAESTLQVERADLLFRRIVGNGESFWDVVQRPYLRRELSREVVRRLIERAHAESGQSSKRMAELLGVGEDYKKFLNFLYHHELRPER